MNFHPIWPVIYARSNFEFDRAWNTPQFGLKFMDLHPGWIGYHSNEFTPILSSISCPVEFQIQPGMKYSSIWVEIHGFTPWSNWVSSQWIYSHFEQYFMPGQIRPGMKYCSIWVEIHGFTPNLSSISGLVELGIIPMNLLPFWAVFHARSNWVWSQSMDLLPIRPGMKYW